MKSLYTGAFSNLPNLKNISLFNTKLSEFQTGFAFQCNSLDTIHCDSSKVDTVGECRYLVHQKIFRNYPVVFTDAFAGLPELTELDFIYNSFTTIKAYQFGGIGNTGMKIFFTDNDISLVEPNAFEGNIKDYD